MIAEEDKVWIRRTCTGANTAGFTGPPNGKPFKIAVMDVLRRKDGRIVEHGGIPDRFNVLLQLGLLPSSQHASSRTMAGYLPYPPGLIEPIARKEKINTSCQKWINQAHHNPRVSSMDLPRNHPRNPAMITPIIP